MGRFGKGRDDKPTLDEVWQTLGPGYGATVEVRGPESVHVIGAARGRTLEVDIRSVKRKLEALHTIGDSPRQRRVYRTWHSTLAVSCANPARLEGTLRSFQDLKDPAWDPRNFDRAHCRRVDAEPAGLLPQVVTASTQAKLMSLFEDTEIIVGPASVRIEGVDKAPVDVGYFGGCVFQMHPTAASGPDRFVNGPPWWIDLLCDIADAVDAVDAAMPVTEAPGAPG